jgi:hypothetical protein
LVKVELPVLPAQLTRA